MGIMDQPVEDGVGDGRIADLFMPVFDWQLTRDDSGSMTVSFLDDFQEISSFGIGHGCEAEIVNHQDMGLGEFVDGFTVASVSLGQGHLVGELGRTDVEGAVSFPAGFVGQGAGEESLSRASGAGDDDIVVAPDPVAGDEVHHDRLVDSPRGFIVDILHASVKFQPGIFQIAIHPVVFLPGPLAIHDEAETLCKGEPVHIRLIELIGEGFCHARQLQFMKLVYGLLIKQGRPPFVDNIPDPGYCNG